MTEQNLPADWAIEEALERGGLYHLSAPYIKVIPRNFRSTLELARMIEKYEKHEKPPVDPDVLAVREILGAYWGACNDDASADRFRSGRFDENPSFLATLATYRRVKGGAE